MVCKKYDVRRRTRLVESYSFERGVHVDCRMSVITSLDQMVLLF